MLEKMITVTEEIWVESVMGIRINHRCQLVACLNRKR